MSKNIIFIILPIIVLFGQMGCNPSESGKDSCENDNDCLENRECNYDDDAQEGSCMEVSNEGFFVCSADNPCPAGQFCFNGLCAPGCMSDSDCAENQYCDTGESQLCLNKEVPTCSSDGDCASSQVCIQGMCSAVPDVVEECTPYQSEDGCDEYSICIDVSDVDAEEPEGECASFPPCPEDGVCPVGQYGALCNDGHFPEKQAICLTSLCEDQTHCPTNLKCVHISAMGPLGICSGGSMGEPCEETDDCDFGLECTFNFCFPGMGFPGL